MVAVKSPPRRHAVMVRLSESERNGLAFLRERESLPGAQVLRRLLVREVRASHQMGSRPCGAIRISRTGCNESMRIAECGLWI